MQCIFIFLVVKALANVSEYHAAQITQTQNLDKSNFDLLNTKFIADQSPVTELE